jgi:hypothetical protein
MAADNTRLEATSKPSEVRLNYDPDNPEAGGQFLPTIFMATKVIRTGKTNADGTIIYETEVIRYDNAKKDNPVVIARSTSAKGATDNNGNENWDARLIPTENATAAEKANMGLAIRNAQLDQVRSVESKVSNSPEDSREIMKVGGDGTETENPDDGIDINEEQASKPLPKNPNTNPNPLENLQTAGGFRYPLDLDTSKQDSLKIVAFERTTRELEGGIQKKGRSLGTPKGTIILPINGQVAADRTSVNYDENSLNFLQGFLARNVFEAVKNEQEREEGKVSDFGKLFDRLNVDKEEIKQKIGSLAAAQALNAVGGGQSFNSIASRLDGTILNPNMELLFKNPSLRSFSFQYLFLPRSRPEANQVMGIIRTLKLNMVPRVKPSFFLGSPNVFQLEYMKGGSQHPFLNKFKVCALRTFDVQYAPLGTYATFPDGVMQAYRVNMQFTELDPVYDEDYNAAVGTGPVPNNPSFSSNNSLIGF